VNVDILGISELKWTGMGEFNSDDHYIYYCGQESLRRNGVAIMENKRVWNAVQFSSVQSLSHVRLFVTPWITARQASLSISNSRSSLKLMCIESVMPSSHLILCLPLLLLPPIPTSIRVFSNKSTLCIRWPKYWSFSFSISPSNEHPGLISFRMDWLDLLAVQGTLKSLLQHHSSKASILQCSAFFTVQLSHPYMTTGKIIALTRWTFVGKVISLLLNMPSRFITFLPRSKHLLISWLQSPSSVILGPKKIKSDMVSTVSSSISMKWWDRNAVLECNLKNDRMISVRFQGKPFSITVIQACAPTSNAKEAERFYEDLQNLLELTPKKDVLFIIGGWNAKVGSQETPGVTGKFGLEV